MICKHCGLDLSEKEIQEHHLHPRFMDNPKGDGMKIPLCIKDHNIIHLLISSMIWKYVPENRKIDCIKDVINFTKKYGGNYGARQ